VQLRNSLSPRKSHAPLIGGPATQSEVAMKPMFISSSGFFACDGLDAGRPILKPIIGFIPTRDGETIMHVEPLTADDGTPPHPDRLMLRPRWLVL
jgi:hypothetical protein